MGDAIKQAAMDARKRAYSNRRSPIQEDNAWAFDQGVSAGVYAALDVLRDRSLLDPAPLREEWAVKWPRKGKKGDRIFPCDNRADAEPNYPDETTTRRWVSDWQPDDRGAGQ